MLFLFLRNYLVSLCEKLMQEFRKAPEQSNILNGSSCFSVNQSGQILCQHKFSPISEPPKQETI